MIKKLYKYFSNPKRLAILNSIFLMIAVTANSYFQVFCIPSLWAIIVLTICFANTIFSPLLKRNKIIQLSGFINGISLFIFIYCIIFLERATIAGIFAILLFGLGLLIYIPHFFSIQLIWRNLIKPVTKKTRLFFILGFLLPVIISVFIGIEYSKQIKNFENFKAANYEKLEKGFLTEKILGMHFIYHTRLCTYDGWRPPKHEPILIMGMWFNNRIDPLDIGLKERVKLYKSFYPKRKIKYDCSCAWEYKNNYHNDKLWDLR